MEAPLRDPAWRGPKNQERTNGSKIEVMAPKTNGSKNEHMAQRANAPSPAKEGGKKVHPRSGYRQVCPANQEKPARPCGLFMEPSRFI